MLIYNDLKFIWRRVWLQSHVHARSIRARMWTVSSWHSWCCFQWSRVYLYDILFYIISFLYQFIFFIFLFFLVLCGDGICDSSIENCVTCFLDCRNSTCGIIFNFCFLYVSLLLILLSHFCCWIGKCGDNFCDAGENCENCFEDCNCCMILNYYILPYVNHIFSY